MSVTKKKATKKKAAAAVKHARPKKVVKPSRPKQNDKEDVRCAYVKDRPDIDHALGPRPEEMWCNGCKFYICENCDSPYGVSGLNHDVAEHDPYDSDYQEEEEEEDDRP